MVWHGERERRVPMPYRLLPVGKKNHSMTAKLLWSYIPMEQQNCVEHTWRHHWADGICFSSNTRSWSAATAPLPHSDFVFLHPIQHGDSLLLQPRQATHLLCMDSGEGGRRPFVLPENFSTVWQICLSVKTQERHACLCLLSVVILVPGDKKTNYEQSNNQKRPSSTKQTGTSSSHTMLCNEDSDDSAPGTCLSMLALRLALWVLEVVTWAK